MSRLSIVSFYISAPVQSVSPAPSCNAKFLTRELSLVVLQTLYEGLGQIFLLHNCFRPVNIVGRGVLYRDFLVLDDILHTIPIILTFYLFRDYSTESLRMQR